MQKMKKKVVKKEDGRYIIFYTFAEKEKKEKKQEGSHE